MALRRDFIDRRSMSTQLNQYFERYAEHAIAKMKDALLAIIHQGADGAAAWEVYNRGA